MSARILVVDDDETSRRALTRLLGSEGHVAHACESAAEALVALREGQYAVLLTDLVMPDMNGLELVRAARAIHPALRCMIMSGHAPVEGAESEVEWVEKPIDLDRLLETLGA